jgi:hypothetical protein
MPKRILLPILITTSVFGIGAGTYLATKPVRSFAQSISNIPLGSNINESQRTIQESFEGQRPRSGDFAFAKDLGVDISKVEESQTKLKMAEANLKIEMQNARVALKNAIVSKARAKNISSEIISKYEDTYRKLSISRQELRDNLANPNTTPQEEKDIRIRVKDDLKSFKVAEIAIKTAII